MHCIASSVIEPMYPVLQIPSFHKIFHFARQKAYKVNPLIVNSTKRLQLIQHAVHIAIYAT